MNKIDKLIKEKCPNGVEYKRLEELSKITIGEFLHKNKQNKNCKYPVYNGGITNTGFYDNFNMTGNKVIISARGANAGFVNKIYSNYWAGNSCYSIEIINSKEINWLYIYQFIKANQKKLISEQQLGSIPAISKKQIENFYVAIPPLEIQDEIVKVLDKFSELEMELNADLEARKKQYEYYREKIFEFNHVIIKYKLKEICTDFIVPMRNKPKLFVGNIPWCRIEDKEGNCFNTSLSGKFVSEKTIKEMNLKVFPTGTVICSCSASIGTYAINTQPLITNQTFIGIVCGKKIYNKYLFYFMQTQTQKLIDISNSGTIPYISRKKFEDLEIPLPSLKEQERIVNILDKFDKLINDISEGLPAEIELRRKQYEYYRNKLLNFKEV